MQSAEQAISEKASYMGKDNLQRSITKVGPQNYTCIPFQIILSESKIDFCTLRPT